MTSGLSQPPRRPSVAAAPEALHPAEGPPPSGWSAIPAAVIAGLLGLAGAVLAVLGGLALADEKRYEPTGVVVYVVLAGVTVALLSGSVLLLRRRSSGQLTVAGAAAVAMCGLGYVLITGVDRATDPGLTWERESAAAGQLEALTVAALVLVGITLLLALLPATGRWCIRDDRPEHW